MNEAVDHRSGQSRAAGHVLGAHPPEHNHCRVMVHVQECQLIGLLAHNEEYRVQQFNDLRKVIAPNGTGYLKMERFNDYNLFAIDKLMVF